MKKYIVRLEAEERRRLEEWVHVGKTARYKIRRANPEGYPWRDSFRT